MKESWKIEKMDFANDFDSFRELVKLSFGPRANISQEMHRWIFEDNPYNQGGHLLYVLKDGSKIIAADGLRPFGLYLNGRILKGAYSVKSMTHPDYRGQGILRTMTENSVERGKEAGVDVIIGYANAASYPAYQKFNWPTIFEREVFVRPLKITNLLYRRIKMNAPASFLNSCYQVYDNQKLKGIQRTTDPELKAKVSDTVPPEVDECWQKHKEKYCAVKVRDYNYLNYRYNQRPDASYECLLLKRGDTVEGFMIFRFADINKSKVASIAEMFTDPHDKTAIASLAYAALDYFRSNDVDYTVLSTGGWGAYKSTLFSMGFRKTPHNPLNSMIVAKPLIDNFDVNEIMGHEKWHISQGEADIEFDF